MEKASSAPARSQQQTLRGSSPSSPATGSPARLPGQKEQHGLSKHPLYKLWLNMLDRCNNPNSPHFHNYGGRGIRVHPMLTSFPAFLEAVEPRPSSKHQLDRKDNDKGYEPGNLRWATKKEQAHNMRKNHLLTVNGETKTLTAWAEQVNLAPSTIHYRLSRGMTPEAAVLTPARVNGRK